MSSRRALLSVYLSLSLPLLASTGCHSEAPPTSRVRAGRAASPAPASQPASRPVRHMVFPTAVAAVSQLIDTVKPKIVAFGEVHEKKGSRPVRSAIWRFGHEVLDAIAHAGSHILVETWVTKGRCGKVEKRAVRKVEATTKRPEATENEIVTLIKRAKKRGVQPHILQLTCEDYEALLDEKKRLDPVKLLGTVTRLMQRESEKLLARLTGSSRLLIYGGALHNDLFPRKELATFAYGGALRRKAEGRYLEIDLYVPEYVEGDAELKKEQWYPLLKKLRGEQVILFERGEASYLLLMRRGRDKPKAPAHLPARSRP